MPRKAKKTARRRVHSVISAKRINEALRTAANHCGGEQAATGPMLPSPEAMGLAQAVLDQIARRPVKGTKLDKKEVTQIAVAEYLDAVIRIRRAAAERDGGNKAAVEARKLYVRKTVNSVLARFAAFANFNVRTPTISLAFDEAMVLNEVLQAAGYGPQQDERKAMPDTQGRQVQQRWVLAQDSNAKAA